MTIYLGRYIKDFKVDDNGWPSVETRYEPPEVPIEEQERKMDERLAQLYGILRRD